MQRAKGKPLLRIVVGAAGYMIEFASEADRESLVDAYTKVSQCNLLCTLLPVFT
jgi:hypothetical protein